MNIKCIDCATGEVIGFYLRMNPLKVNAETGFLETKNTRPFSLNQHKPPFDAAKKVKLLNMFREQIDARNYPEVHVICDAVGVSISAFRAHLAIDPAFQAEWQEIKLRIESVFAKALSKKALTKMGTLANLAILRHLENGSWNGESRVIHETDNTTLKGLLTSMPSVVDAEIVPETVDNAPDLSNNSDSPTVELPLDKGNGGVPS